MQTKTILYNLRKKHSLTQSEMAQKLFVTRQAVSRWEKGETVPNIDTLRLISQIFDISINSLVDVNLLNDAENDRLNARRFLGFAELYEDSRPTVPEQGCRFILNYLGKNPEQIVDLGCGTGLSTMVWKDKCGSILGVDPSVDMLSVAVQKETESIKFKQAYSDNTYLPDDFADIVVCSQSFHWMNPSKTLAEVNRILKAGGVFATVDCDWPPICDWRAEQEYAALINKISMIENENADIHKTFKRWNKENHLKNIKDSGYFRYAREIVFSGREMCNAERFIGIALSQGSMQTILKIAPQLIEKDLIHFKNSVSKIFADNEFEIHFCYRLRIGIK